MPQHPTRYGYASCALFAVAVVTSVFFDQRLSALPMAAERGIGFLTLVMPAGIGMVLGLIGLNRMRDNRSAAVVGLLLNAFFGAFFSLVLLLGG